MDKDEMNKRGLKRNIYCMPYNAKLTKRAKVVESYGISIMRFTNEDVFERFDYVCKSINDYN